VKNTNGRATTQQFSAPGFEQLDSTKGSSDFGSPVTSAKGQFTFGDFLNLFLFNEKYDLGAMIRLLQTKGVFQSLAEPNLVAESGKEASFLAGGEIPIPIAQGSGGTLAISVQFKEFGVRLSFTPTVIGDRIHLKVKPEVSSLDFTNAVVLQGFRIPALTTRRTETELELQNRQTFAISGLLNNSVSTSLSKVPGIGDIPVLGYLFRSKAAQKNQTELVVMITPEILPNNSSGVTPSLPRTPEPYLGPMPNNKTVAPPPQAFGGARQQGSAVAPVPAVAAASTDKAETAAAAVSALTPSGPKIVATPEPPAAPGTQVKARKPSDSERRMLERARREEDQRVREQAKIDERLKADEQKRQSLQAVDDRHKAGEDRRKADEEKVRQEKLAREQKKKDQEESKKREEAARKQAEHDREQQKSIEEAAARLKAAEAQYNTEVAKKSQP
jgi:hypothetical protein